MKILFNLSCRTEWGQRIHVIGSPPALGEWNTSKAILMEYHPDGQWKAETDFPQGGVNFEYKYIIKNDNNSLAWEGGSNRKISLDTNTTTYVKQIETRDVWHDNLTIENIFETSVFKNVIFRKAYSLSSDNTKIIIPDTKSGKWKGAGIAIPVFSLRSNNSLGIGEFLDLKLLADWAKLCGFQIIQVLPVNDTSAFMTERDSSPYSNISVFALHPIYINIQHIRGLSQKTLDEIAVQQNILNNCSYVDYEKVITLKMRLLKEIFLQQKDKILQLPQFEQFLKENSHWLKPYAAFCFLRDKYKTTNYSKWEQHRSVTGKDIEAITSPNSDNYNIISFSYFVQYHLHLQLLEASEYAKSKGVVLKGDLPIGISKYSDSCWINPEIFHLDQSAGAPPDPFSDTGQNWNFPTYNWEAMAQTDYIWWRLRLNQMSRYFQMTRLDHVLGFFRIWEIPEYSVTGLMGHFSPSIPFSKDELEKQGIWDFNRLCEPYIPKGLVDKSFGPAAEKTADIYLDKISPDQYKLKREFSTQKQADRYFAAQENNSENKKIKDTLFMFISNIIFFTDKDRAIFHPRINMMNTSSFIELSNTVKEKLKNLYYDYFYHRQDDFWRQQGKTKLPILKSSSDMLICGEDLGMVPDCVPPVMEELGILGLRIQRMPKESGQDFGIPSQYPYLTVCTTSSHDMSTIRGWWEEDPAKTQIYYNNVLKNIGPAPKTCEPNICEEIIEQHLESSSMWAIFPIQDILGISNKLKRHGNPKEEQINIPADPYHVWKFRLHLSLEKLIEQDDFNLKIRKMISDSGRYKIS